MRLAIMQPYIFPYIGYFQLISAVDKFVIYDDVNYIKQGWINRNRILLHEKDFLFTIPLSNVSSFMLINQVGIHQGLFGPWKVKFYKTLHLAYSKAPYYSPVLPIIEEVFEGVYENIGQLAAKSITCVLNYLAIDIPIVASSAIYQNKTLSGRERVMDICLKERATTYINALGGMELYSKEYFANENINLHFIKPEEIKYRQLKNEFVPWLSIIDILMFNSPDETKQMLNRFTLI